MGFQGSLSFPANPVIGQTVDHTGKTFEWTGTGWRQITPSFQLVNPAGIRLLGAGSVNNVASVDFVLSSFTARYRGFLFKLILVPVSDANSVLVRFSTDGGTTFDAGATDYNSARRSITDAAATASAGNGGGTSISCDVVTGIVGNGANEGSCVIVELFKPTSAALWPRITLQSIFVTSDATPLVESTGGGGSREAAQDVDAIRFLLLSGNISNGDYAWYGYT